MREERVFIEIVKHDNGDVQYSVGGGLGDGCMEYYDTAYDAIESIKSRVFDIRDEFKRKAGLY